jgi:SAM-dependent methyltransferase
MISTTLRQILKREPIEVVDGIPVFCDWHDRYVKNYEQIAKDHVASIERGVPNPWIAEDLWLELEESTKRLLRQHLAPNQRILDIGVGLGRLLKDFSEFERHGLDITFDYLQVARSEGIEVIFGRVEDMPYRDETFDIVLICDVLEHVLDLYASCAEILRVLKPGGIVIVRVPFREDLSGYLDPAIPYEYIHMRDFNLESGRLLFEKIFDFDFVQAVPTAYRPDPGRLRLRLPGSADPLLQRAAEGSNPRHPLHLLHRACSVTANEMVVWLREMKATTPELFEEIAPSLLWPWEMNFVFRKPQKAKAAVRTAEDALAVTDQQRVAL